jgi:sugar-specific transcriptional regulator TrmB
MEIEKDNSLPFLDVLISHHLDGSLTHQVYINNTHIGRYLHVDSHNHLTKKYIVLKNIITRAIHNSAPQFLEKEKPT